MPAAAQIVNVKTAHALKAIAQLAPITDAVLKAIALPVHAAKI